MGKGFEINENAIRRMTREIQREFDKNPIHIPLEAEAPGTAFPSAVTNNYHGPVVTIHGNNAQLAWDNETATQTHNQTITPGYEELAKAVTGMLASLPALGLPKDDELEAKSAAESVLGEVIKDEPDQNRIKQGITMLKGLLAPVATGVGEAISAESADLATTLIHSLGTTLPF